MNCMASIKPAVLFQLKLALSVPFILHRRVILAFTLRTLK